MLWLDPIHLGTLGSICHDLFARANQRWIYWSIHGALKIPHLVMWVHVSHPQHRSRNMFLGQLTGELKSVAEGLERERQLTEEIVR